MAPVSRRRIQHNKNNTACGSFYVLATQQSTSHQQQQQQQQKQQPETEHESISNTIAILPPLRQSAMPMPMASVSVCVCVRVLELMFEFARCVLRCHRRGVGPGDLCSAHCWLVGSVFRLNRDDLLVVRVCV